MKNASPQQSRWLSYISEFGCTIHHVSGEENYVADALSRIVHAINTTGFDAEVLQSEQESDMSLQKLFLESTLTFVRRMVGDHGIICNDMPRPYVPTLRIFQLFKDFYELSLPGPGATLKLIQEHYVWPGMRKQIKTWAIHCERCQRAKINRHTKAPVGNIPTTARFHTVHFDLVGPLPLSEGHQYLVTMVDRFTRWVEVVPIKNITTETVASAFISSWISRFEVPRILISDRGAQFESNMWGQLMKQLGIQRKRTTVCHPSCNGAIERFHRTLKNSLRAKCDHPSWTKLLLLILLGIRSSLSKEGFSPAQLVYGSSVELPTQFFVPFEPTVANPSFAFVKQFFSAVSDSQKPIRDHSSTPYFIPKDIETVQYVWLLDHAPQSSLSPRYSGPFEVMARDEKTMTMKMSDRRIEKVSINRLIPAHLLTKLADTPRASVQEKPSLSRPVLAQPSEPVSSRESLDLTQRRPTQRRNEKSLYSLDNVVLAKFPRYPWYPALVVRPSKEALRLISKDDSIRFFGTGNRAFILKADIQPFRVLNTEV